MSNEVRMKYVGNLERYFETASTGKQQSWRRGQESYVSQADAKLLYATGNFEFSEQSTPRVRFNDENAPTGIQDPYSGFTIIDPDSIVPAVKFGVKFEADFATSRDQTDKIQSWLNALAPGQNGLLPTRGWSQIGGDLTVPRGVTLHGGGILYSNNGNGAMPRLKFAPTVSPGGRNTRLNRVYLKRIGVDVSEATDVGATYMANLVFDGVVFDGTWSDFTSATANDCVVIGKRAYEIHFVNHCYMNNFTGWLVDVRCTTGRDGSGTAYVGTGVRITFDRTTKFVNAGGASGDGYGGFGGAVRVIGAPQDSGTIILDGAIFDTCVSGLWVDNENQSTGLAGPGGSMMIRANALRMERCGRLLADTNPWSSSQPVVFARRANLELTGTHGIGMGANMPAGYKFIDIRGCSGKIEGAITGVDNAHYVVYNDDTHAAFQEFTVDIAKGGGLVYQVSQPVVRRDTNTFSEAILSFTLTKSGAAGAGTMAMALGADSSGAGTLSTASASGLLNAGVGVTVGSGKTAVTYAINNNSITITLGDRTIAKVLHATMKRNSINSSTIIDCQASVGVISLSFANQAGAPANWYSLMTDGQQMEFAVTVQSIAR
jgi:hypothetical protein